MELKLAMRKFGVFIIPVLLVACWSVYWINTAANDPAEEQRLPSANPLLERLPSLDRMAQLGPKFQQLGDDQALLDLYSELSGEEPVNARNTQALLVALADKAAQGFSYEAMRDGEEYQLILAQLQSNPAARQQVLAQFMKVSGTPLGKTLSLALATSGSAVEMPKLKAVAARLLQQGSEEQRLDALKLLGATPSYDPQTRAKTLEVLRTDAVVNPELAMAAMVNLVKQSGGASPAEQQQIVKAVYPFVKSDDPQLRLSSLQVLATLASSDKDALQVFADAVNDADPNVRSWVISAMANGEFAYDSVREPLLATLQNPEEDPAVKAVAQQALEHFSLDDQAQQVYQAHLASESYQAPKSGFGFN